MSTTQRPLTAASTEALDAAVSRAAVLLRDDRAALVVSGADRLRFLHNLWTQALEDMAPGTVREATLCDVKGALQATALVVTAPTSLTLWVEPGRRERVMALLDRYIIMDDVTLRADDERALIELLGPESDAISAAVGLPRPAPGETAAGQIGAATVVAWREPDDTAFEHAPPGHGAPRMLCEVARDDAEAVAQALVDAGAVRADQAAADALRVLHGRPDIDADLIDGTLPIELGMRGAVSFAKGCYLGQEAIVMMTHRGQLRRHLCWVYAVGEDLPPAGSALKTPAGGDGRPRRAGRMGRGFVTHDGRALGLAIVMRKAFAHGAVLDAVDDNGEPVGRVRVVTTTWPRAFEVAADGVGA